MNILKLSAIAICALSFTAGCDDDATSDPTTDGGGTEGGTNADTGPACGSVVPGAWKNTLETTTPADSGSGEGGPAELEGGSMMATPECFSMVMRGPISVDGCTITLGEWDMDMMPEGASISGNSVSFTGDFEGCSGTLNAAGTSIDAHCPPITGSPACIFLLESE
ncbi:MAG: hypothetical protein HRU17_17515 [Polyangiaceae bacterium]|nr:hypothetical protein [Polyangiaceae bacterium]